MKQINPPELTDVLLQFKKDIFKTFNCHNIGVIQSFDTTKQTAKIQLSIKKIVEIKADGTKVLEDRPVLAEVPCIILGGSHNVRVPILTGDIALVLFNDRDMDNWFVSASGVPNTLRTHDLSDAIAITGLHNFSNSLSDFLNDRISLYWDANSKIEVLNALVNIITTLCKITGNLEVTGSVKGDGQVQGATLVADNGITGDFYVASTPGGSPTVKVSTTKGIRTT